MGADLGASAGVGFAAAKTKTPTATMHTVRAEGQTARTELDPVDVALAVGLYLVGYDTKEIKNLTEVSAKTLQGILQRLGLTRSREEWVRKIWVDKGKVSQVARRRILKRDYTKAEIHGSHEEIAGRFNISASTLRRDLAATGLSYDRSTAQAIAYWGSVREWHEAQRHAALLCRKRGCTQEQAARQMGISRSGISSLLNAYDERKEKA